MNRVGKEQLGQHDPYRWYAVYTRSRAEKKVLKDLEQKGIECYLPLRQVKRRWGRISRVIEEPLITCYVFLRVSPKEYYRVLIVPDIVRYVCFDGAPAAIPGNQIESLKVLVEHENEQVEVSSEQIGKGDLIRVIDGPLKDLQAEVAELRGKRKLVLRFRALGCNIHVDLGTNRIELLKKPGL